MMSAYLRSYCEAAGCGDGSSWRNVRMWGKWVSIIVLDSCHGGINKVREQMVGLWIQYPRWKGNVKFVTRPLIDWFVGQSVKVLHNLLSSGTIWWSMIPAYFNQIPKVIGQATDATLVIQWTTRSFALGHCKNYAVIPRDLVERKFSGKYLPYNQKSREVTYSEIVLRPTS